MSKSSRQTVSFLAFSTFAKKPTKEKVTPVCYTYITKRKDGNMPTPRFALRTPQRCRLKDDDKEHILRATRWETYCGLPFVRGQDKALFGKIDERTTCEGCLSAKEEVKKEEELQPYSYSLLKK